MTDKSDGLSPEIEKKLDAAEESVAESGAVEDVKRKPRAKVEKVEAPKSPRAAISRTGVDDVKVDVGPDSGKSLSVHHIQRRLVERGHGDVYRDRDGFWGDNTTDALEAFAVSVNIDVKNRRKLLESLFENDSNVNLVD